jgi:hypothetical protein
MNHIAYVRGSLGAAAPSRPGVRPVRTSRGADYVADIFFIALLAAPFLIFDAPGSMPDAVAPQHEPALTAPANAASTTAAASMAAEALAAQPSVAAMRDTGPE